MLKCHQTIKSDQINRLVKFQLPRPSHFGFRTYQSFRRSLFFVHRLQHNLDADEINWQVKKFSEFVLVNKYFSLKKRSYIFTLFFLLHRNIYPIILQSTPLHKIWNCLTLLGLGSILLKNYKILYLKKKIHIYLYMHRFVEY